MVRRSPQFRPLVWFLVSAIVWSACALLAGRAASSPAPLDEPSPAWTYQCDSQVVDMIGAGLHQHTPRTLTIPDSSWSYLQVGGKGYQEDPPRSTTLTFADADSVVLDAPTRLIDQAPDVSSGIVGYTFETPGKPGTMTVALDDPDETADAVVAYYTRPLTDTRASGAFSTTLQYAEGSNAEGQSAVPAALKSLYLPLIARWKVTDRPDAPTDTFYVTERWGDLVDFNGAEHTVAYEKGYNARVGTPNSVDDITLSNIILAFGRQQHQISPEGEKVWGVNLKGPEGGNRTNEWVRYTVQEFYNGYNDGHTQLVSIAIGTSNGNYDWACDNSKPEELSTNWREAGEVWGTLVTSIEAPIYVLKRSANDIEAWNDPELFGPWKACGAGTVAWLEGYASVPNAPRNINFGSNVYVEYQPEWTRDQLYRVSGAYPSVALPQIYCTGQPEGWVDMRRDYFIRYFGVTATDGIGRCGEDENAPKMLEWYEAWDTLYEALSQAIPQSGDKYPAPYPESLLSSVSNFDLSP